MDFYMNGQLKSEKHYITFSRFDDKATLKAFTLVCITCFMYIVVSEWWTLLFFLDTLDKQLMILLNYTGGRFADRFWYAYSQKFIWTPLVLLTLLALFVNQKGPLSHKLLLVVAVVLMVAVLDQISSGLIKPLVARLRPSHTPLVAICFIMSMTIMAASLALYRVMPPTL